MKMMRHDWHDAYVGVKKRMFNDVVSSQFKHLNGPEPQL